MSFRLLPKDVRFFELFVADGENLHAAATRLHEMVATYENVDAHVVEIQRLEKAGDEIDREINRRLEDAFITPFDREDIHTLVGEMDDIVDNIDALAKRFPLFHVKAMEPDFERQADVYAARMMESNWAEGTPVPAEAAVADSAWWSVLGRQGSQAARGPGGPVRAGWRRPPFQPARGSQDDRPARRIEAPPRRGPRQRRVPASARAAPRPQRASSAMPSPFVELEVGERVVKVTNPD